MRVWPILVVGALCAGAAAPLGGVPAHAVTAPPNIVVILADDLDAMITSSWAAMPKTAALLRDKGLVFTNAFVPSPDCCPARSSLLTGLLPHNDGVFTNLGPLGGGWQAFHTNNDEQKIFPVALQNAGYRTGMIGKYLNNYRQANAGLAPPPGWSDWEALIDDTFYSGYSYTMDINGTAVNYGTAASDYSTDVLANRAVQFIDRSTSDSSPFFAYLAPTAPHTPLGPPPRYATNSWSQATAPQLPTWYEPDLSDKPTWLQLGAPTRDILKPTVDQDYRNRMGSLMALDDLVGNVVDALTRDGKIDNTYIVFTSDNGYELGAHHITGKLVPYDESIRVPLIITGPGITPRTDTHLVSVSDLAPTALEWAGLTVPSTMDTRSLNPLITNTATTWRKDLLFEYHVAVKDVTPQSLYFLIGALYDAPSYEAVRNQRYKFVQWYTDAELPGVHEYELYDLWTDPYELNNLIKTSTGLQQYASIVKVMQTRLQALMTCAGSNCSN